MTVAFTSQGESMDSLMDSTFGRAQFLVFLDTETNELEVYNNTSNAEQAHGAGPRAAKELLDRNVELLITGNMPGGNAMNVISSAGIKIHVENRQISLSEAFAQCS